MMERTELVAFHATPSVKIAMMREASQEGYGHSLSLWLFQKMLTILREKGHEVSEHE